MKAKRVLTEKQLVAIRKNAAKARKALALKIKRGEPVGRNKSVTTEIPLALVPTGKAQPVTPAKRKLGKERVADRETVDALAQLIVATFAEFQRRKGTL